MNKNLIGHINTQMYDVNGFIDYHKLCKLLHLPAKKLAVAIGISASSLTKYSYKEETQNKMSQVLQIWTLLTSMLESKRDALAWLRAPNNEFKDSKSPLEVICSGNAIAVLHFLEEYKKGSLA